MAVYPSATYRPLNQYSNAGTKPRLGAVLHVNESNGASLFDWISSNPSKPDRQMSCHFQVAKTGAVEQYIDTDNGSWCQVDGNDTYISIETEGFHTEPLTTAQLNAVAGIMGWLHSTHGIPLQLAETPGQPGFGWHGMGGTAWGGHFDCPGVRRDQRQAILTLTGAAIPASPVLGIANTQQSYVQQIVAAVKARSLPIRAAIVAVEVALTESSIQMYANASNPDSLALPHDAVGNDHGSVGLYQQQVGGAPNSTANWGTTAELMNVGISTGKFLDVYVTKDQAQTNWQIAQSVQGSAFSDGSNYQKNDAQAQQIVNALWAGGGGSVPPSTVTWQTSSGGFFGTGTSVADFGPYTGPWPLLPSAMVDPHGAETDFVVGTPNADGTIAHFADGTYSTDVFTAWRYDNSDYAPPLWYTGYYHNHYGSGTFSPDMPADAHLYVVYYPATYGTAPLHEPAYYVPPTYGAGGTAANETSMGHWSDTQDWTNTQRITYNGANGGSEVDYRLGAVTLSGDGPDRSTPITAGDISANNGDLAAMAVTAQDQINTGNVGGDHGLIGIHAEKTWHDNNFAFFTAWHAETDFSIVESQARLILDGSSVAAWWVDPAPMSALQQEIDYSDDPYNGDNHQYIGTAGPIHWSIRPGDFNRTGIVSTTNTNDGLTTVPPLPADVTISLRAASGDTAVIGTWSDLGVGDEFLSLPVHWPDFPATQGDQNLGTIGDDSEVDIPVVSTKILLVMESVFAAGTGVPAVTDFPMPSTAGGVGYSVEAGITNPVSLSASSYRPFRYWIPGPILPSTPATGGGGPPPPPPPLPDGPPLPPPPKRVTHLGTGPESMRIHFW